jgi:hypothetical protein
MAALQAGDTRRATEVMAATPIHAAPPDSQDLVRSMLIANERIWKLDRKLAQEPAVPALKRLEELKVPRSSPSAIKTRPRSSSRPTSWARRSRARVVRIKGGGHLVNLTSQVNSSASRPSSCYRGDVLLKIPPPGFALV